MTTFNSRRSFFRTMGAGVSAALVPAASSASRLERNEVDDPVLRTALREEEKTLRLLHHAFEQAQDRAEHDELIAMFADEAEVIFNRGVFRGRAEGVTRLYRNRFVAGGSGRRMEPAPGFELSADRQQDEVRISPDRLSATALFPYSLQIGAPLDGDSSLVSMARLHGEGVRTWWEGGVYDVAYLRGTTDGRWQIARLEYRTLARADYRTGRTYATPIAVPRFSTRFPRDQTGPDEIV